MAAALFVLFYLIFLLCMGVPVTDDGAGGRTRQPKERGAWPTKHLEKPGSKWHIHGWFCILGCYMLMMYYTTVSGWMMSVFLQVCRRCIPAGHGVSEAVSSVFGDLLCLSQ